MTTRDAYHPTPLNRRLDYRSVAIVIPARMESTRLPGKPLRDARGKLLLMHAWEAAHGTEAAQGGAMVFVATDSRKIRDWCRTTGICCHFDESTEHPTGSDRVAAAITYGSRQEGRPGFDRLKLVVNLQCDEPDVTSEDLDRLIAHMFRNPHAHCMTFSCPWPSGLRARELMLCEGMADYPDTVKVLTDRYDNAIYFGRGELAGDVHVGVYAFSIGALNSFADFPRGLYEQHENLEQLRLLENGLTIRVLPLDRHVRSINTWGDLDAFNADRPVEETSQ